MPREIFDNLPVRDLERAFNPQFTDDKAACKIVEDNISVMLLAEPFFKSFTAKPVADARKSTQVLVCLSCASKDYQHAFEDFDGHIWKLVHTRSQP